MARPSPEVRHARASDAGSVTRLLAGIYQEERFFVGDGPASPASLAARITMDDPHRSLYLVAVRAKQAVGWLELHRSPAWRLEHVAVLTLAVAPGERRQGLGRALLERAYAWCREVGALKVSLQVRAGNRGAIALYESEGFQLEGRECGQVRLKGAGAAAGDSVQNGHVQNRHENGRENGCSNGRENGCSNGRAASFEDNLIMGKWLGDLPGPQVDSRA